MRRSLFVVGWGGSRGLIRVVSEVFLGMVAMIQVGSRRICSCLDDSRFTYRSLVSSGCRPARVSTGPTWVLEVSVSENVRHFWFGSECLLGLLLVCTASGAMAPVVFFGVQLVGGESG